ncbi:MAG: polysaccharide deacetylase family protein [Candidatus Saccharibacteria bacterium]
MLIFYILLTFLTIGAFYWLFLSPYSQIFGPYPYHFKTDKKVIALTFDDGPNEPYTSQIVDYLDSKEAKATFFVVGNNAKKSPLSLKKMIKSGHSVGAHSINHKFINYLLQPSYKNEIKKSKEIIYKITGKYPVLFRSPWLWHHPLLFSQLKKQDLIPTSGIFCSNLEVFKPSAKYIANVAIKKAYPGSIIIFHDGYNSKGTNRQKSVDAVKIFVNNLTKKGYIFVTVEELFELAE